MAPATLVPTLSRPLNAVATLPVEATLLPDASSACPMTAGQPITGYRVTANLNYTQRAAMIRQDIRYINRSNDSLSQLVLVVDPNQWPRAFRLLSAEAGATPLGYELTGRQLTVDLPETLEPGCEVDLTLDFQLNVPEIGQGITAYRGFLGHSPRQLNLGNWLPMIVPHLDGGWVLHDAVLVGEQIVLDVADWDVTLNVSGAPETLEVAGPGEVEQLGAHSWHFTFSKARDFTVSLSDEFRITHQDTADGIRVELYSFDDAQVKTETGDPVDGAAHALDTAVKSVAMYEDLYGPYPHSRLAVVEGDFPDGMEFSGLVFVSRDWFTRYTGNPAAFLTVITAHEVSHQWWYATVGSDQALTPWLDEALATYSEYAFIEEYYPDLKSWWWDWRVDNYSPQGFVDSTVYQFSSIRDYINAIYLLGARMLQDLRTDLGTERFFDLLRHYYEAGAGRVVSPEIFWSLLSPDELAATQATRKRFLRQPTFGS
ncbi:MAG: M1 family metallopeptidase [Anaerolineae bacterium]|nr:M1 family metallopeptidase [Anaerolineae bacterium]